MNSLTFVGAIRPRTFSKIFFLLFAVWLFAGCSLMTREDIQKQQEERQLQDQVSSIQKSRADSEEQYNDLEGDLRTIAGRVDTLDHNQQVAQQQHKNDIEALKKIVAAQNDKIAMLEQHIDATETRLTAAIQAIANAAPPAAPAAPAAKAAGKDKGKKGQGALWVDAEKHFSKKDFKEAILKYQSYLDKNPKGAKSAEATYKIGVCFAELGRKREAREFYQATIDTYPGTPSSKKAKFRLSQLK